MERVDYYVDKRHLQTVNTSCLALKCTYHATNSEIWTGGAISAHLRNVGQGMDAWGNKCSLFHVVKALLAALVNQPTSIVVVYLPRAKRTTGCSRDHCVLAHTPPSW